MRVLVTRPEHDAQGLIEALQHAGHTAIWSPALTMTEVDGPPIRLEGYQAILVTSANAIRALANRTAARKVKTLCVGPASAAAARDLGFDPVIASTGEGVAGLVDAATTGLHPQGGPLFYPSAEDVAGRLEANLSVNGFQVDRQILYRMNLASGLMPEARTALQQDQVDVVAYYSVRSIEGLHQAAANEALLPQVRTLCAVCISPAVETAAKAIHAKTIVASAATQDAMIAALARLGPSGL
jgi:uroporphyrinogen-III synthase